MMTSDWAAPTIPVIATCCRISVSEKAEKNLPPSVRPNTINDTTSTISDTADGLECRK
ncbi:hypothetical protein D3C73_959300 [compost metagenome]